MMLVRNTRDRLRTAFSQIRKVSWQTLPMGIVNGIIAITATLWLTPAVHVSAVGQDVTLTVRAPGLTYGYMQAWEGQHSFDFPHLRVYGPIRPLMSWDPVTSDEIRAAGTSEAKRDDAAMSIVLGWLLWFALAGGILFVLSALLALAERGGLSLWHDWRVSTGKQTADDDCWLPTFRQVVAATTVPPAMWLVCGAAAVAGAHELTHVHSLADLSGHGDLVLRLSPAPVGPEVHGVKVVVMGDSRAVGLDGEALADPTADDTACRRGHDSLAHTIQHITHKTALDLSCYGAKLMDGIEGPQTIDDHSVEPQLGYLKQVKDVEDVIVVIGPNDVWWANLAGNCYTSEDCNDGLTDAAFEARLDSFTYNYYYKLLPDLEELSGDPRIIIMLSYGVMSPDATCDDARGKPGLPGIPWTRDIPGLDAQKISLLDARNDRLNTVLHDGAAAYGFTVAYPMLTRLCDTDSGPPDIQGLSDPYPFHPTHAGTKAMARSAKLAMASTS
jgi:hypothetical protein